MGPLEIEEEYLNPACLECIKQNTLKEDMLDTDGSIIFKEGEFPIRCNGILNEKGYKEITRDENGDYDDNEYEAVREAFDRAYWARKYANWEPRSTNEEYGSYPYQEIILNCTAYRKVYRLGRRLGKCFSTDSLVVSKGGIIKWGDIKSNTSINAYNVGELVPELVDDYIIENNGIRDCVEVATSNGYREIVTRNHPYYVKRGNSKRIFIDASDLQVGDILLEVLQDNIVDNNHLGPRYAAILAYIAARSNGGAKETEDLASMIVEFNIKKVMNSVVEGFPVEILSSTKKDIASFIGTYFLLMGKVDKRHIISTNGVKATKLLLKFKTATYQHALYIYSLLSAVGIFSSIKERNNIFNIVIDDAESINVFYKLANGTSIDMSSFNNTPSYRMNNIRQREVVVNSITDVGKKETISVHIPSTNIIGGFLVSHNTEVISMEVVYDLLTTSKKETPLQGKDTIITPAQTQRDEIIERVRNKIYGMGYNKKDFVTDKDSPVPKIKTTSGSSVTALVTGTSPGSQAISVRSQGGDKLILDEAAYFLSEHVGSFMPLLTDHDEVKLIASSTPRGKDNDYYRWCMDPTFKEFHLPSTASPYWSKQMERDARSTVGPIKYKIEYLAEFIDADEAVFSETMRHRTFVAAPYGELYANVISDRKNYIISFGVDWNGQSIGTRLIITAKHVNSNEKIVIHKHAIYGEQNDVSLESVSVISQYNNMLVPEYIYIDIGYGDTQYSLLKKRGYKALKRFGKGHPEANLVNIMPIRFGGKIDVPDPIEKKKSISMSIKAFMVSCLSMYMEEGALLIPKTEKEIDAQMENYKIKGISENNTPIYKPKSKVIGDHDLDALMLSLLPFRLNYDNEDIKGYSSSSMAITANPYEAALLEEDSYLDSSDELHNHGKYSTIKEARKPSIRTINSNTNSLGKSRMTTFNIRRTRRR